MELPKEWSKKADKLLDKHDIPEEEAVDFDGAFAVVNSLLQEYGNVVETTINLHIKNAKLHAEEDILRDLKKTLTKIKPS